YEQLQGLSRAGLPALVQGLAHIPQQVAANLALQPLDRELGEAREGLADRLVELVVGHVRRGCRENGRTSRDERAARGGARLPQRRGVEALRQRRQELPDGSRWKT